MCIRDRSKTRRREWILLWILENKRMFSTNKQNVGKQPAWDVVWFVPSSGSHVGKQRVWDVVWFVPSDGRSLFTIMKPLTMIRKFSWIYNFQRDLIVSWLQRLNFIGISLWYITLYPRLFSIFVLCFLSCSKRFLLFYNYSQYISFYPYFVGFPCLDAVSYTHLYAS